MTRPDANRNGMNGRYSKAHPASGGMDNPERDHTCAAMRRRGMSYRQIANEMGWAHESSAHRAVARALQAVPKEDTKELLKMELARLDHMYMTCVNVLETEHVTVSNGRLVTMDGTPIPDDGPVMAAIDRMLRISERRAKMLGLDAPSKSRVEIVDDSLVHQLVDEAEREIAKLSGQMERRKD